MDFPKRLRIYKIKRILSVLLVISTALFLFASAAQQGKSDEAKNALHQAEITTQQHNIEENLSNTISSTQKDSTHSTYKTLVESVIQRMKERCLLFGTEMPDISSVFDCQRSLDRSSMLHFFFMSSVVSMPPSAEPDESKADVKKITPFDEEASGKQSNEQITERNILSKSLAEFQDLIEKNWDIERVQSQFTAMNTDYMKLVVEDFSHLATSQEIAPMVQQKYSQLSIMLQKFIAFHESVEDQLMLSTAIIDALGPPFELVCDLNEENETLFRQNRALESHNKILVDRYEELISRQSGFLISNSPRTVSCASPRKSRQRQQHQISDSGMVQGSKVTTKPNRQKSLSRDSRNYEQFINDENSSVSGGKTARRCMTTPEITSSTFGDLRIETFATEINVLQEATDENCQRKINFMIQTYEAEINRLRELLLNNC